MGKRNADNDLYNDTPNKMAKHDIELSPNIANDFVLTKELVDGKILTDLYGKKWKIGKPIGKFKIYFPFSIFIIHLFWFELGLDF